MGRGRAGFLNTSQMKNKKLAKARKGEPYWGAVKTSAQKGRRDGQLVCLVEQQFVEMLKTLEPQEVANILLSK